MTYVITQACVDVMDKTCIEECPVDCIYEGSRMLYINPDECVDCGACEPVCPQEAIFHHELIPQDLAAFVAVNATFFEVVDGSRGAAAVGPSDYDAPLVAALPREEQQPDGGRRC